MTEEVHACRRMVGYEITKRKGGSWGLTTYVARLSDDPSRADLLKEIKPEESWKESGIWNLSNSITLIIQYCPFCGQKLVGSKELDDNLVQSLEL